MKNFLLPAQIRNGVICSAMNVLTASTVLDALSVLIYICIYRYKENEANIQPS